MTVLAFPNSPLGLVLSRLHAVAKIAGGHIARCPAHKDGRPSLSVSEGNDGRILLHCFAGCSYDAILSALTLEPRDLAPASPSSARPVSGSSSFNVVAEYDYLDAEGKLRFQVVRLHPKDFRQRHPGGPTGWIYSMKGVERLLYRLPQVLEAIDKHRVIFIVEGEKDANTLAELGLVATTNPGGAKKWQASYTETLRGANVVIIPDNDKSGREHADRITAELHGAAKEMRVVHVPAPHKDVTEWFSAGATTDDLKALVLTAPLWQPEELPPPSEPAAAAPPSGPTAPPPAQGEAAADFHLTDIGNAERLILRHGLDLRFVPAWRAWLEWDSKRWQRDETHAAERRAKETVRAIFEHLKNAPPSKKEELYKHAMRSEGDQRIGAMLRRAMAEPGVSISTRQLDADPWLLTVANGTLDLRTAELREHERDDLITKLVGIEWNPDAPCDRWEAFLDRIMGGNKTLISWLQRAVGYSLTGMTTEQCFFLLHGVGANGKTTFLEILRAIAGEYAAQTDFTTFTEKKGDGPRNDVARLFSARVVTSSEVGEGKRFNESLMKSLAGSEMISARFLYAELFEFMPTFKVFLAANHKPVIRGTDEGIWRRVRLIPFTVQIPPAEQDKDLLSKLRDELPGILAWAVAGCILWQREGGLGIPEEVRAATAAYRTDSDTLGAFIDDYCERGDHPFDYAELATDLYAAYAHWAKEGGEFQMSQTAFGRRLEERGINAVKRGTGAAKKVWRVGVKLLVRPPFGGRYSGGSSAEPMRHDTGNGPDREHDEAEGRLL